jgi:hypothetical protein
MKKLIPLLPLAAALAATPCLAGELDGIEPSTQFYLRIPIGPAASVQDRQPSFGLAFKGRREYQTFMIDSRVFMNPKIMNFEGGILAALEAKWLIVGAGAAAGAYAITRKSGGSSPKPEGPKPEPQPDCTKTC